MTCDSEFFEDGPFPDDLGPTWLFRQEVRRDAQFLLAFNVEFDRQDVALAQALLSRHANWREVITIIRACGMLQDLLGGVKPAVSEAATQWNENHETGQPVRVELPDADPFLSRTTSPALDTAAGPVVLVDDHDGCVPLSSVTAVSINCQEL